ncbi:hypothetical protein MKEN_00106400 [Mycena kentingensis (nom. inval.)]|nr:hypothetical protein MKEN_00106400 [Mycena kentingensis (nom. inval.)]
MATPTSYLTRLLYAVCSFFLAIFCRKHPAPVLPTANKPETHFRSPSTDSLVAWQQDKQNFLRRPSLVKATIRERPPPTRPSCDKSNTEVQDVPPPLLHPVPAICVQDWSAVEINMAELLRPSLPAPALERPTVLNTDPATIGRDAIMDQMKPTSVAVEEPLGKPEPTPLSAGTSSFTANALSAVSGSFFDFPALSGTVSTALPFQDPAPQDRERRTSFLGPTQRPRDSILPYPDLFDFDMYGRRVSQENSRELLPISFETEDYPIVLYDINRPCTALPSSPKRSPLKCAINIESENVVKKGEDRAWADCDELARHEWTEDEFLGMFTSGYENKGDAM